jgi:hypothetical protein
VSGLRGTVRWLMRRSERPYKTGNLPLSADRRAQGYWKKTNMQTAADAVRGITIARPTQWQADNNKEKVGSWRYCTRRVRREESLALACLASLVARRLQCLVHNQSHFSLDPCPSAIIWAQRIGSPRRASETLHAAIPCAGTSRALGNFVLNSIPEVYSSRLEERSSQSCQNSPQETAKMIQLKVSPPLPSPRSLKPANNHSSPC